MEKRVPQKQRGTPVGLPDMDNDPELRDDPLDLIEPQNGKALTFKQRLFAEEYLVDGHGPMAALRAGFAPFGVYNTANRLLGLKRIRGYIARRRAEKIADTHMDQDWVLAYTRLWRRQTCGITWFGTVPERSWPLRRQRA